MILFMGVAGAGKSIQGRLLADEFGLPWLSTGEFLRMLVTGDKRKAMVAGELLGDQEIISLVQKIFTVVDTKKEFVLDGFPRTPEQADWLLGQVKHGQLKLTAIVNIKASREEVLKRLVSRGRQDDTEEVINSRFDDYEKTTLPMLDMFKQAGAVIVDVNGEQSLEAVHQSITEALKDKLV